MYSPLIASSFTSSPILCSADFPDTNEAVYLHDDKQAMSTIAGFMPGLMLHELHIRARSVCATWKAGGGRVLSEDLQDAIVRTLTCLAQYKQHHTFPFTLAAAISAPLVRSGTLFGTMLGRT